VQSGYRSRSRFQLLPLPKARPHLPNLLLTPHTLSFLSLSLSLSLSLASNNQSCASKALSLLFGLSSLTTSSMAFTFTQATKTYMMTRAVTAFGMGLTATAAEQQIEHSTREICDSMFKQGLLPEQVSREDFGTVLYQEVHDMCGK
jgi:hypothetical protein